MSNSIEIEAQAQRTRTFYIAAMAMAAAMMGFNLGFDGSIMGAAIPYIADQFHLSPVMYGFIMTNAVIGCIIGPFLGGWLCDWIGREKTLLVCVALIVISAIGSTFANPVTLPGGFVLSTLTVFSIFRIICGLSGGLGSLASPMYIAEVAPPKMRGKLGLTYQLSLVVGSAVSPLVAYLIVTQFSLSPETVWRWMFASQLAAVALLLVLVLMLPPSPRWLAEKGRFDEALVVLLKIHEPALAAEELRQIKESVNEEQGGWSELFSPGIRFALFVGLCLAFFNNWTGWSAMGGYITKLVEISGVSSHAASILDFAITYISMAVVTAISLFLVDRVGRRPLWIFASIMMAFVTLLTGFVFHLHLHGPIVLVVLCLCTVPHGIALGGLPWLMMSELYPNRVRAKAVAFTTTFLWIVIYSCGQLFPVFLHFSENKIGSAAGVFWLFTGICILSTIFGYTIMPETKGRTLEDIAASWKK
jgi:SP family arabinose:H+ symporter-like MFS transporter